MIFERGHFKSNRIQKSIIMDSLNESRNFNSSKANINKTTVFLSHKHKDLEEEEEARGVIEMLEDLGVKVYIDRMDNILPNQTSGDTAKRIKEVIKHCDKFILLATAKAIDSLWCNWELGIGDVHKYLSHIAIIPIKEKGEFDFQYKGNEYLQIYPIIEYRNGSTNYSNGDPIPQGYYVKYPKDNDGHYIIDPLRNWLKKTY